MKKSKIVALLLVLAMLSSILVPFNKVLAVDNSKNSKSQKIVTNDLEEIKSHEMSKEELENLKCMNVSEDFSPAKLYSFSRNSYASTYGYNKLDTNNKKNAYLNMQYAAYVFHTSSDNAQESNGRYLAVSFDASNFDLTREEMFKVYLTFYYDNPEFYWLDAISYYYNPSTNKVTQVVLTTKSEYANGQTRSNLTDTIERNIELYLNFPSEMSNDFEKEWRIHDVLIYNHDYAYDSNGNPEMSAFAHNIVGVFDDDETTDPVCEGYAKAFMLLLNASGIDCGFIAGLANGGGHAWNQVKLDNQWYNVDVTWDDPTLIGQEPPYRNPRYTYFNVTDSKFTDSHVAFSSSNSGASWCYDTFACTATKYSYENQVNSIPDASTLKTVTYNSTEEMPVCVFNQGVEVISGNKVLPKTKLSISVLSRETNIAENYEVDVNGVRLPLEKIADANGKGFIEYEAQYTAIEQDMEFKVVEKSNADFDLVLNKRNINFTTKGQSDKLTVTFRGKAVDTSKLQFISDNSYVARIDSNGNVTSAGCGTATISVVCEELGKEITCNVVSNIPYLRGDVDNNGSVNIFDAYALLRFLSTRTTVDEIPKSVLMAGDFDSNDIVSIFDAYALLRYLANNN